MSTDIKGLSGSQLAVNGSRNQISANDKNQANSDNPKSSKSSGYDNVSLTDAGKQLQQLEQQLKIQPVVNANKVEAARQAIENGAYEIKPDNIARQLMQFESLIPAA